ncbi:MAG: tRNA (adenine57-N1/adenine58-N1)-methyltransferase [Candidatus Woesearchaeota archaeon]|jgi:tRNA (adenine57-N1/adenine58-N1)-methyltransferase
MFIQKILITKKGETYYIQDASKDYHSTHGFIRAAELEKAQPGDILTTSKGTECAILDATFFDNFQRLKRGAALILPKDAGAILAETMVGNKSIVVDAGGGMGGLTCFLANYVKKVHVFDLREDHLDTVKENVKRLELTNVEFGIGNVYESIPVKNVDLVTLDVPEPHEAYEHVFNALKPGGFLVCYIPCANQLHELIKQQDERFLYIKSFELIQRHWDVTERKIRPKTSPAIHTGFLCVLRKVWK